MINCLVARINAILQEHQNRFVKHAGNNLSVVYIHRNVCVMSGNEVELLDKYLSHTAITGPFMFQISIIYAYTSVSHTSHTRPHLQILLNAFLSVENHGGGAFVISVKLLVHRSSINKSR